MISISENPEDAINGIKKTLRLKDNKASIHKTYLGADIKEVRGRNGVSYGRWSRRSIFDPLYRMWICLFIEGIRTV